jgi:hypothetical protein
VLALSERLRQGGIKTLLLGVRTCIKKGGSRTEPPLPLESTSVRGEMGEAGQRVPRFALLRVEGVDVEGCLW